MKNHIAQLVESAVGELSNAGLLPADCKNQIRITHTRQAKHGEFTCNLAMLVAKKINQLPNEIANKLVAAIPPSTLIEKIEIAAPGFINFFISASAYRAVIDQILTTGERYGCNDDGRGRQVLVEFVSANPTGPLHVGHGRGAALGDSLARVLRAAGWQVQCEYYINDGGRQMDILAVSIWLRYLELFGLSIKFPANGYRGDYIRELGLELKNVYNDKLIRKVDELYDDLSSADIARHSEKYMDELIARSKKLLGVHAYNLVHNLARDKLVDEIRDDLIKFGVQFDQWFSEQSLQSNNDIDRAMDALNRRGFLYEKDGAKWFRASQFGDEKDRAVQRSNAAYTYFAADIAYHFNKGERGFDRLINIFGADHHGYAKRIAGAYAALGFAEKSLRVLLVQFATLYRNGEKIPMSTRDGKYVTLRELCAEIGNDAARFFYVARKNDQHMDFDLNLAKAQVNDNPVYYIQYAHARICSVFRQLAEKELPEKQLIEKNIYTEGIVNYELLTAEAEFELMKTAARYPDVVAQAARDYQPHLIAYYLRELASQFHTYYNAHPFLASEPNLRRARLGLIAAIRQVLSNGLKLLGVSAPQKLS